MHEEQFDAALEPEQRYPRRFYLSRQEDPTGISGTGVVADGVVWQDGTVTIKWLGDHSSEVSWRRLEDMEYIHGHGGKTMVIWRDDENGYPFHEQTKCPYDTVPHRCDPATGYHATPHRGCLLRGIEDVEAGRVKRLDLAPGERHIPD